jgi:predicted nucleic acid-binding protein
MNLPTDSAVWLALYDRSDKYHNQAQLAFQELAERKVTFVVTDYLIAESVTLIMGRAGHVRRLVVKFAACASDSNRHRFMERGLTVVQTL